MSAARRGGRVALAALLGLGAAQARAATIEGRVVHATRPAAVAGLPVELLGIAAGERHFTRALVTSPEGVFRFEDLPSPGIYLVYATLDGIRFPGGSVAFREGEPEPATPLQIEVFDRGDDAGALALRRLRWVIAREAGVYEVDQTATIVNASQRVFVGDPNAPAPLRVALAPGHGPVRTEFLTLPEGVREVDGALAIRGPLVPGETQLRVSYTLGLDPLLETEVGVLSPIDELEIYVQDFGIVVDAGGLHPARPARDGDVFYQLFLGFDLEPGRVYPLRVAPLPPRESAPAWLSAGLVVLLAGLVLYFVGAPIAGEAAGETPEEPEPGGQERDALREALADLEFDYELGKLSDEDRDRMRRELRSDTARALARGRSRAAEPRAEPALACECGRAAQPGDRFCAACGKAL